MKTSITAAATSAAITVLTFTTGCSGGSQLTPHLAASNPTHVAAPSRVVEQVPCNGQQAKVFVTEELGNDVKVFDQGTLLPATPGPFSGLSAPLGIDVSGDHVYVANSGLQNIAVFNKCGNSVQTLPDPTGAPNDVALDVGGNLYVSNSYDGLSNGEVRYYQGASGSGVRIGDPLMDSVMFVTVDTHNNVFTAGANGSFFHVDWCRYARGNRCNKGRAAWAMTSIPLHSWPTGIRIDANGRLVVSEFNGNISTYNVPSFTLYSSQPCPGAGTNQLCGDFGFDATGNRLFVTGSTGNTAWRVNYPSFGGQQTFAPNFSPNAYTWGVAAWPAPAQGG